MSDRCSADSEPKQKNARARPAARECGEQASQETSVRNSLTRVVASIGWRLHSFESSKTRRFRAGVQSSLHGCDHWRQV